MAALLALILINGFLGAVYLTFSESINEKNEKIVMFMLGQLSAMTSMAVSYYFGSTSRSAQKDMIIAQSQPIEAAKP